MDQVFKAIVETDAAILQDVDQMTSRQTEELDKFNKMLDAFIMDLEARQVL